MKTQVLYCSCYGTSKLKEFSNDKTADCAWKEDLPRCKPLKYKENKCAIYGRKKREIEDDFEFDVPLEVFEWENGWTEQKAINACKSHFQKSKLYKLCSKIIRSSKDDIKSCVNDIKMSGSDIFLSASLDSMRASCLNELRTNTTFWKPKPRPPVPTTTERTMQSNIKPSSTTPSTTTASNFDIADIEDISIFDIAEEVFNNDCPNDCSESGTCQQGPVNAMMHLKVMIAQSTDGKNQRCTGYLKNRSVIYRKDSARSSQYLEKDFTNQNCKMSHNGSEGSPIIVYDSTCTTCKGVDGTVDCEMREDVCIVERKCYRQDHECKSPRHPNPVVTLTVQQYCI
ncbi:unnamed protein product [Mytilus edulis]|uniref:Vwde helical domain-containing protein n=1 Tax=Mytilus edulis TaxID=6550 RepID=A0A8S3UWQ9_MYTED|nr:unnamed protein product [Mytilus edulis]